jgi:thioredoxin-related protein
MKINKNFIALTAVFIWMVVPACTSGSDTQDAPSAAPQPKAQSTGVTWYGYDEGMALGKTNGKSILINFYADWCGYCRKMDKEIFSKSDAADFINQNFVPIKINADNEKQLAQAYRVSGLPSTWFLDENGEEILNLPGYLPKEMFTSYMKFVQTESYQSMSFRKFMGVE